MVAVTSGANMNFDRLRLVTELADLGANVLLSHTQPQIMSTAPVAQHPQRMQFPCKIGMLKYSLMELVSKMLMYLFMWHALLTVLLHVACRERPCWSAQ